MARYLDKWKTDFPASVGNVTRPTDGIDNTLGFNTDGFPQRISSDPVHYKLENDMASQLFSNDARLKESIEANKKTVDDALANHNKNAQAHANGIAGNAATATKLKDARTITVNLGSTTGASFNGTANVTPGVNGTLPVANGGTGATSLDNVTVGNAKTLTGDDGFYSYMHRFGENLPSVNDLSTNRNRKMFMSSYSKSDVFTNQPETYGTLINIPYGCANEVVQLWISQPSGALWYRGSNGNTELSATPFTKLANITSLDVKVDKVAGKGLSTNDYTTAEKTKLAGIESNANKYILPVATNSVLGGVKVGTGLNVNNGVVSVDTSNAYTQPLKWMGNFAGKTVKELKSAIIKETYSQSSNILTRNLIFDSSDLINVDFSNDDAVINAGMTYTTVTLQNCTPGLTYGTILIILYSQPAHYVINVWDSKWSNPAPILTRESVSTSGLTGKFTDLLNRPTTLRGYGITDAKIENGVVTLGNNSIKPITTIPTASASTLGGVKVGSNLSIANGVLSALAASQSVAGYMSAADKKKLDGIASGANAYSLPTASASTLGGVKVGSNLSIANGVLSALAASQTVAGYMSAADKKKLDGIASGANAYSLPTASASTLGGVKVGSNLSIANGVLSANAQSLGIVAGDVSNANAWWVKLGGTIPLIIQGGKDTATEFTEAVRKEYSFPIAFRSVLLAGGLGFSDGIDGGKFQPCGVYSYNNTSVVITGSDNGNCHGMWIAIGIA